MLLPGDSSPVKLNTQHQPLEIGEPMKQLAIEMIGAAIIATIVGAAFWIMDWNGFIGWVYVWVLIGITLSIGKKLDR
jgi:hypothetical protein